MMQNLKKQNGIGAIAVILIIVVAAVAGGATFLGVRMLVTGESFLAPFEELGWFETTDKEDKNSDEEETEVKGDRLSLLSSKATKSGVNHYQVDVNVEEIFSLAIETYTNVTANSVLKNSATKQSNFGVDYKLNKVTVEPRLHSSSKDTNEIKSADDNLDTLTDVLDFMEKAEVIVDLYAKKDELVEGVLYVNYGEVLKPMYNYFKDLADEGKADDFNFDSYSDFENEVNDMIGEYFTKEYIAELITDETNLDPADVEDCIKIKKLDGAVEVYFEVSDDINDQIKNAIDDYADELSEELADEMNINVKIDPDTYVEDFIGVIQKILEEYEDGMFEDIISIKKVK